MLGTTQQGSPDRREVAWIGGDDSPKHVYKRDKVTQPWVRASSGDWQAQFSTFQALRRQGYRLVHPDGSPVLDDNGNVMGTEPLAPAKSDTPTMEVMEEALNKLRDLDLSSVPDGEEPITRLLSLNDRMSLIRFKDSLQELPRETLVGHVLQATLRLQGQMGMQYEPLTPEWLKSVVSVGDASVLGQTVVTLAGANKESLLAILDKMLPEIVRLEGLKGDQRGNGAPL